MVVRRQSRAPSRQHPASRLCWESSARQARRRACSHRFEAKSFWYAWTATAWLPFLKSVPRSQASGDALTSSSYDSLDCLGDIDQSLCLQVPK